eukprot:gene13290-biopygen8010
MLGGRSTSATKREGRSTRGGTADTTLVEARITMPAAFQQDAAHAAIHPAGAASVSMFLQKSRCIIARAGWREPARGPGTLKRSAAGANFASFVPRIHRVHHAPCWMVPGPNFILPEFR